MRRGTFKNTQTMFRALSEARKARKQESARMAEAAVNTPKFSESQIREAGNKLLEQLNERGYEPYGKVSAVIDSILKIMNGEETGIY